MSDDIEARIEVIVKDDGRDSPSFPPPNPSNIVVPEYNRRPAASSPSVGIAPVFGGQGTLPERNIRGQFISRAAAAATGYDEPSASPYPRDARGRYLPRRDTAPVSPRPEPPSRGPDPPSRGPNPPNPNPNPPSRDPNPPSPFAGMDAGGPTALPSDQLALLTPEQRRELQETWGLDLGEPNAQPQRTAREQHRINRMKVGSFNQQQRLTEAAATERQQRQAEADRGDDNRRTELERAQRDENREAVGRMRRREAITRRRTRRAGRGNPLLRSAASAFSGRSGAARVAGSASRMLGASANAALGVGVGVAAGAAAFAAANAAANKLAGEGLYAVTKATAEWIPFLGQVVAKFQAIEDRFKIDKERYGKYSFGLTQATAFGEADITMSRLSRLYQRDSVAGGQSLDELMGDRQRMNYRFQNANEDIEAAISKALYNWSSPWINRLVGATEALADKSELIGNSCTLILELFPLLISYIPGISILPLILEKIGHAIDWWMGDAAKKNAEEEAQRMRLFSEKFQSNLMAIFNDGTADLNDKERAELEGWMRNNGGKKRPKKL